MIITHVATRLEAWTTYMSVITAAALHRTAELIAYQQLILTANCQFLPSAWLEYDRQLRMLVAQ